MKAKRSTWWLLLAAVGTLTLGARVHGQNYNVCIDPGPQYGSWTCLSPGSFNTQGSLDLTDISICAGQSITAPVLVTSPTFNDGVEQRSVTYICYPWMNTTENQAEVYTSGPLYFVPSIPATITTPGIYTYEAHSDGVPVDGVCGTLSNVVATVTIVVGPVPTITSQPTNQIVCLGNNATFIVGATGTNLTYQWRHSDTNLPAATSATLIITNVQPADAGNYYVTVWADGGCPTNSATAVLTVVPVNYTQVSGSLTNYVFRSDTTYLINGSVILYGTNILEGGAVIKYKSGASLNFVGTVDCRTAPYHPAILTAKDDNTAGEIICDSTGTPSGYYASYALLFTSPAAAVDLHDLRILYAASAVGSVFSTATSAHILRSGQFGNVQYAFNCYQGGTWVVENALISQASAGVFASFSTTYRGTHLTIAQSASVLSSGTLFLTNSLLVSITNAGTGFTSVNNATNSNPSIFQTAGAGNYYLDPGSPYRNAGTTNLSPALAAALKKKTTWPPASLTNTINFPASPTLNLDPIAPRDTDVPDLGYHYDPLDYLCSVRIGTGGTLVLTNGVALGFFGNAGIYFSNRLGAVVSQGKPEAMNHLAWYVSVQEQPISLSGFVPSSSRMFDLGSGTSTASTVLQLRFTDIGMQGLRQNLLNSPAFSRDFSAVSVQDCWLRAVNLVINAPGLQTSFNPVPSLKLLNNEMERSTVNVFNGYNGYDGPLALDAYNNLFWNSTVALLYLDSSAGYHPAWNIKDTLFDTGTNSFVHNGSYTNYAKVSNNGFFNTGNQLGSVTNVTVTNLVYAIGPLGSWYQGSVSPMLIDQGSRTAAAAGLYHYTVLTNISGGLQVKETNSIVDIGFHFVATDSNGNPIDTDGDGTPDYLEDANGNGSGDTNEPPWSLAITVQPQDQYVIQGSNVTFNVTAVGAAPLSYQWRFNGTNIAGATASSYTKTSAQLTNVGNYSVVVSNFGGTVTSVNARLTLVSAPSITSQPGNITIVYGQDAVFSVQAAGTAPLSYQWRKNGTNILGATSNSCVVLQPTVANSGDQYSVLVSNNFGSVLSGNAGLTVNRATLSIVADNKTRTYGAANPAFTWKALGFVNNEGPGVLAGDPSRSTTATTNSAVGTYSIVITNGTLSAANYSFLFLYGTLSVTKAPLTVTANNKTKTYGTTNPTLNWTATGFVNGQGTNVLGGAPQLSTTAATMSPVGIYPITIVSNTLSSANYSFSFVNGTLTINPAMLTVTAVNTNRGYAAENPAFLATYSGFAGSDTISVLSGQPAFGTPTISNTTPIGTYTNAIVVSGGTLSATNYTFGFVNGTLTILADAVISLASSSMNYLIGSPPGVIHSNITINAQGSVNFSNATLTAKFLSGQQGDNLSVRDLPIGTNSVGVVTNSAGGLGGDTYLVTFGNGTNRITIGSFKPGTDAASLVIHFNNNATATNLTAVARSVTYSSTSTSPSESLRLLRCHVTVTNPPSTNVVSSGSVTNVIWPKCADEINTVLILDKTGSMGTADMSYTNIYGSNRLASAKMAAITFLNYPKYSVDKVKVLTFYGNTNTLTNPSNLITFTNSAPALSNAIAGIKDSDLGSFTIFHPSLRAAYTNLINKIATNKLGLIVFLTDGKLEPPVAASSNQFATLAMNEGLSNRLANIRLLTVGIGGDIRSNTAARQLLTSIASSPQDFHLFTNGNDLAPFYSAVENSVCRNTNQSPIVTITFPTNGQAFLAPTSLLITATASSPNGPISWVRFFAGTNVVGTVTSTNSNFQVLWNPVLKGTGTWVLTALATDVLGSNALSSPVTITVRNPPMVTITNPINNAVFSPAPTNITISATATADGATISSVVFYQGSSVIATDSVAPYSIIWSNVAAGSYTLQAVATDSGGATGDSDFVDIKVRPPNQPPVVDPGPNQTNRMPTAFFLPGRVSDDGLPDGVPLIIQWSKVNGPGTVTFSNSNSAATAATFGTNGSYVLKLLANDSQYTVSSNVTIAVRPPNLAPVVDAGANQAVLLAARYQVTNSVLNAPSLQTTLGSRGKEFWLGFLENWEDGEPYEPLSLTLYIASEPGASGSISVPGLGIFTNFSIPAGGITLVDLDRSAETRSSDVIGNTGIHIRADNDISVYGLTRRPETSDAYLGLPINAVGTNYVVGAWNGGYASELLIVGTAKGTTVTIKPTATDVSGRRQAGETYSTNLNQGQTYQLQSGSDLTGTIITSDKPISVFGGNRCAVVLAPACNVVIEQLTPQNSWGREFFTVPLATRVNGDVFQMVASADQTTVRTNGDAATVLANRGDTFQVILFEATQVTADKPILLVQYATGQAYGGPPGDPLMMLIPPFEQFLGDYTFAPSTTGIDLNFVNIVTTNSAIGFLKLDGEVVDPTNFFAIGTSGYSGARLEVLPTSHHMTSPLPFGIFVYGFGDFDGYGYAGGLALGAIADVATVSLNPKSATNEVGTTYFVIAGVTNQNNQPLAGVRVDFQISGNNTLGGLAFTDENGQARFYYTGTNLGVDSIRASVGTLGATATNRWEMPFFNLHGSVFDDGLPAGITNKAWTQSAGPSTATFSSTGATNPVVHVNEEGFYVFRLTADDTELTNYDEVTITTRRNQAPSVDAGTNLITKAAILDLNGSVSDDGLPADSLTIKWSKVSGPGTVSFADPSLASTTATFSTPGIYVLRLTGDDSQAVVSEDVAVTILVDPWPVQCGDTVNTNLTSTDRRSMLLGGSYADYYTFSGSSNQILVVTMTSASFDTYLIIRDQNLNLLAEDDDISGSTDSQIIYLLPADGDYLIEATSSGTNQTGSYSIQFGCGLAPKIKLTSPLNGAVYTNAPTTVVLTAEAADADGIQQVDFYANDNPVTTDSTPPYTYNWLNVPPANYVLTAVATDNTGASATSAPVTIIVGLPTLVLSPATNCPKLVGAVDTVTATLNDGGGHPIPATNVTFTVVDVNFVVLTNRTIATDSAGVASFSYQVTNSGRDQIFASAVVGGQTINATPVERNWARPIACSQIIIGTLSSFDGTSLRSGYADYYTFIGQSGDNVKLTLRSLSFDTYLILRDQNCNVITNNDDSNGRTDSQITATLPATGNYIVEVTSSLPRKVGAYNLQFDCDTTNGLPEIGVFRGAEELANYATVTLGTVAVGTGTNVTLTITNSGTGPLTLSSIGLSGEFTLSPLPTSPIPPGSSTFFTVHFDATTNGSRTGLLTLVNNDADNGDGFESPFTLNLQAAGNIPGPPPTVVIVSPTNNASYPYGQLVPVTATATAATGAIAKVEFFVSDGPGRLLIGRITNGPPFSINWIGPDPGSYSLTAEATDNAGRIGYALPIAIQIQPADGNHRPIANPDDKVVLVNSKDNVINVLTNDFDPDGDELTIVALGDFSHIPGTAAIIDNGKKLSFTPLADTAGGGYFLYVISDTHNARATNQVTVSIPIPQPPQVNLINPTNGASFTPGAQVTVTASVSIAIGAVGEVEFFIDGRSAKVLSSPPYSFTWTATIGTHDIYAILTDSIGQQDQSGTATISVNADPNDHPPRAVISTPATTTDILGGVHNPIIDSGLDVMTGEATDQDGDAVSYQINLYLPDGTPAGDLTPKPVDQYGFHSGSVSAGGVLATNDYTRFANGTYELELVVRAAFRDTRTSVMIELQNDLKIGNFSFSQQDLLIPVSGIPLTVMRTYNSLNQKLGDFGYGWTYEVSDMDVTLNDIRDDDTVGLFEHKPFSMRIGGNRDVTLTLPDSRRATFYFNPDHDSLGNYYAKWDTQLRFTGYTLTAQGPTVLAGILGAAGGQPYWQDHSQGGVPMENFDFYGFILSAPDGTQYIIDRKDLRAHDIDDGSPSGFSVHAWGKPYLHQIIEPSHETITIEPDSIVHRDTQGNPTRRVVFQRDATGLIRSISDPNNLNPDGSTNGPPARVYQYDSSTNLMNVLELVDRTTASYVTNTYTYTNRFHPHFITGMTDARGIEVAKSYYDDDGRLIAIEDAAGKLTRFLHSPGSNLEMVVDRLGYTNSYLYDTRGNIIWSTNALKEVTRMAYDDPFNPDLKTAETNAFGTSQQTWKLYQYDSYGNKTSIVDSSNRTNGLAYDGRGKPLTITDPLGTQVVNGFDDSGNLTNAAVVDALGNPVQNSTSQFENGHLVGTKNGSQVTGTYYYDATGNLTNSIDANGVSRKLRYDANGNQIESTYTWTPPGGGATVTVTNRTEYDAAGRITLTVDGDGNTNRTVYIPNGKVDYSVDKYGNTNSFLYDARGNVVQQTYADGLYVRTFYDANAKPIFATDRNGVTGTRTDYDGAGRAYRSVRLTGLVIDVQPRASGVWSSTLINAGTATSTNSTEFYESGLIKSITLENGQTTHYAYWPDGRLKYLTNALNQVTFYKYDGAGRKEYVVDALNHTNRFEYDAVGRLIKTTFPDNSYTSNYFNPLGQRAVGVDQAGRATLFGYDPIGHLTNVVKSPVPDPENGNLTNSPVWSYLYDNYGQLTVTTDPKNHSTTNGYDALNRQITQQLPMGQIASNVFNGKGQLSKQYDFKGQRAEFVYDQFGRIKAKFYFNSGAQYPSNAVCYLYNRLGQLTRITERFDQDASTNACDGFTALVGPPSDGSNIATASIFARGVKIAAKSTLPLLGLALIAMALSLVPRRLWRVVGAFYLRGHWLMRDVVTAKSLRRLRLPSLAWRIVTIATLISLIGSDPHFDSLFTARAQCSTPLNLSTSTTRITDFAYDIDGHLTQVSSPEGVVNYGYDANGRHTSTCTANSYVEYGFDILGRLKDVTAFKRNGTALSTPEVTSYTYDAVGNRKTVTLPGSVVTTYDYDSLNRLTNVTHQAGATHLASYSYKLDSMGHKTNAVEVLLNTDDSTRITNTISWKYDGMYRLTNEISTSTGSPTGLTHATSYEYDKAGNRWKKVDVVGGTTTTTTNLYNANDQLLKEVTLVSGAPTATNNYVYDANGSVIARTNITSSGTATALYGYNLKNKLGSLTTGVTTTSYLYNEQGIRVRSSSSAGGNPTLYLVDANNHTGFAQVLEELTAVGGLPTRSFVIGDDVLAQCGPTTGDPGYLLYDGHGSTRQLLHGTTNVTDQYNYDAYGLSLTTLSNPETPLLYSGEQYDSALNMYNLRARYYDPSNGRFNQRDPFAGNNDDPQSLHKYLYANCDPVNNVDPSGQMSAVAIVICIVVAIIIIGITIFQGIRHGDPWYMIVLNVIANIATFFLICVSLLASGAIAVIATLFLIGVGIFGLVMTALNWSQMDTTDKVCTVVTFICFIIFAGAVGTGRVSTPVRDGSADPLVAEETPGNPPAPPEPPANPAPPPEPPTAPPPKPNCFVAGTLIATENGLKPIEKINTADKVWSFDESTGTTALKGVLQTFKRPCDSLVNVHFGSETVEATTEHPFWVEGTGWVPAEKLQTGDLVKAFGNTGQRVSAIERIDENTSVYNFEVADFHAYFVSAAKVLVHNQSQISLEEALDQAQQFMEPGVPIKAVDNASGIQFIQVFKDAAGNTIAKRAGIDIKNNAHVQQQGGPHLNLQTRINNVLQETGPLKDPHTPIDPATIKPEDVK